jgi:peptidoglycan/LPS O-acetylase OafA/YrhL
MVARLRELFALCLLGAVAGWAAGLALSEPAGPPGAALIAYGAMTAFGCGYLAGSALRRRPPRGLPVRAAAAAALVALATKTAVPTLAEWAAVLVAAGVFGVAAGFARTR